MPAAKADQRKVAFLQEKKVKNSFLSGRAADYLGSRVVAEGKRKGEI